MTVVLPVDATPSALPLILRPWAEGDLEPLVEVYRDRTLRRWTRTPVETTEDGLRWLEVQRQGWAAGSRLSFAVLEQQPDGGEGRLLANVVVKRPAPGGPAAEVGYWTAQYARGRGVAPRALDVLTGWAFEEFAADGLERLELLHQVDNHASCRVAEKTGYLFEQVLAARPPFPNDGHLHVRWGAGRRGE